MRPEAQARRAYAGVPYLNQNESRFKAVESQPLRVCRNSLTFQRNIDLVLSALREPRIKRLKRFSPTTIPQFRHCSVL